MEKEFIPYEQALALKELGFDKPCFGNYIETDFYDYKGGVGVKITKHIVLSNINGVRNYNQESQVSAPTFSQAFRWFREKYGKLGCIKKANDRNRFIYLVNDIVFAFYDSYEEAELECLKKLIEIVKEK